MDIKVVSSREEPLLSRSVVKGFVGFEAATPSRSDVRKQLAAALKAEESKVAVPSVEPVFGERKAAFVAHVYASQKDLERLESIVSLRRHGLRPKKVKAAKEVRKK